MACTDCGFDTSAGMGRVTEDVVWAKLAAMAEGARIATQRLFLRTSVRDLPKPVHHRVLERLNHVRGLRCYGRRGARGSFGEAHLAPLGGTVRPRGTLLKYPGWCNPSAATPR